jgi:PEP-CTERM motif
MKKEFLSACKEQTIAIIGAAAFVIAAGTVASATTVLSDGTFNNITATATYSTNSASVTAFAQCTSTTCGNAEPGLEAQVTTTSSTNAYLGVIDNLLSYDPSSGGAISTIAASYDRKLTLTYTPTGNIDYILRALIEQDGNTYVADITLPISPYPFNGTSQNPATDGWVNLSTSGLTASDFALVDFSNGTRDPSSHPNFAGGPILFGIAANIGIGLPGAVTANYDNLSFTVSQTPLPASLPLFVSGAGLIGLLALRRKRKLA